MGKIKLKSEIYIRERMGGRSWIRIYSHVKQALVYHSVNHPHCDILPLLDDLQVNPGNTIIHIHKSHPLFQAIEKTGYVTRQSMYL